MNTNDDAEDVTLSEEQEQCVDFCLDKKRRLAAVTGQAGTGKTTIIKFIARRMHSYVIAAPTGKAAKRIQEATGLKAVTIHKLLEYGRPRERDIKTGVPIDPTVPRRGRDLPLDQAVVLCDEYSMVNHELNRNLIDALPKGGRLIMFGDVSQLSPIEPYPLKNGLDSPFVEHLKIPGRSFELTQVYRHGVDSDVFRAAQCIRQARIPIRGEKFKIYMSQEPVKTLRRLIDELKDIDFSTMSNQILSPVRSRWIGTGPLNVMLRNLYNPHGRDAIKLMRYAWDEKKPVTISVGDKVVCTENTYDMRNYSERFSEWDENGQPFYHSFIPTPDTKIMINGEAGRVKEVYPDTGLEIDFGDRTVEVPYSYEEWSDRNKRFFEVYPQRAIDLAYALTTHKAQGSEYDNVIYIINKTVTYMMSRENFYTAVTRARDSVHVITDGSALNTSLRVDRETLNRRSAARHKTLRSLVKS